MFFSAKYCLGWKSCIGDCTYVYIGILKLFFTTFLYGIIQSSRNGISLENGDVYFVIHFRYVNGQIHTPFLVGDGQSFLWPVEGLPCTSLVRLPNLIPWEGRDGEGEG